jgi:hypothetical protein
MAETHRHLRWERTGRKFEVLDDLGQPIPNKLAFSTRIGETNVDLGNNTFAPYLLDGATLKHGDSQCDFSDGWQTIKYLGQTLISKSRLFIQRDISGVWADVPHGLPTRNVVNDYPTEGRCTAYLDFPDIQGYAQGARLQMGIEVGGGDRQVFGYRMRSPVAGTFRLEWVLEIPDDVDLSWIEAKTSITDPTPIRIGGRIGNVAIRWSKSESQFRSATVESDGAGGRILHLFLGPYTLASQEWLTVYPDTLGPYSIAADANDGQIGMSTGDWTLWDNGGDGDGIGYAGCQESHYMYDYFRFTLTAGASLIGATISDAYIDFRGVAIYQWTQGTYDALILASDSNNPAVPAVGDRPSEEGGGTTVATATVAWNNITWDSTPGWNRSPSLEPIFSELLASGFCDGNGDTCLIWLRGSQIPDVYAHVIGVELNEYAGTSDTAQLTIVYYTSTIEQEGFRFRNDDGSESAATWKANQDTNITLAADTSTRIRMLLNATGDPASIGAQLEARYKPSGGAFGPWTKVN